MFSYLLQNRYATTLVLLVINIVVLVSFLPRWQDGVVGSAQFFVDTIDNVSHVTELFEKIRFGRKIDYEFDLFNENRQLHLENAILSLNIQQIHDEVNNLSSVTGLDLSSNWLDGAILTEIITKDFNDISKEWYLDAGMDKGIEVESPVVGVFEDQLVLVGRVIKVDGDFSTLAPIISESTYISAEIKSSQLVGLAQGRGFQNKNVSLNYISKDFIESINIGDEVVSAGIRSLYPEGLPLGKIVEINNDPFSLSLDILVAPYVDTSALTYVYVLQKTVAKELPLDVLPEEAANMNGEG